MAGRVCVSLSHAEKRQVCSYKDENPKSSLRDVAEWATLKFGKKVSEPTTSKILKNKQVWIGSVGSMSRKRVKTSHVPQVEESLYRWFLAAQEQKLAISDKLLMMKARSIHEHLEQANVNLKDCKYTNGWVEGFKRRHNIRSKVTHKEGGSLVLTDAIWDELNAVKAKLLGYEACDVFNMDETGLFYKLAPNRTLADEQLKSEKKHKDRLTVALATNMDGSIKFPPLVINKSLTPRAFTSRNIKNPENLGIQWYANRKAWMTAEIFEKWLIHFDATLCELGRKKTLLLVDNAPWHICSGISSRLKVTEVVVLSSLTTSRFQPMDAGIIKSLKAQYRKSMIQKFVSDFDEGIITKLDVYDAVTMLEKAWRENVTTQTIMNCWKYCGLTIHVDEGPSRMELDLNFNAELEDEDLEMQMGEVTRCLDDLSIKFPVSLSTIEYLDIDVSDNASTYDTEELLKVDPILDHISENDDEPSDSMERVTFNQVHSALDTVLIFLMQQESNMSTMARKICEVKDCIEREHVVSLNQSSIDMYFGNRER